MELLTTIFISRSGAGKGTQIEELIKYIESQDSKKVFHLESGERFRQFMKQDSYPSELARKYGEAGYLQPSFLSVWAWTCELINRLHPENHLLIDGTPRRLDEAKMLDSALKFYKRISPDVIYLDVSEQWAMQRMLERGRGDDEKSKIERRLQWFKTDVLPVVDFFKNNEYYNFHQINGERSITEVQEDIKKVLEI